MTTKKNFKDTNSAILKFISSPDTHDAPDTRNTHDAPDTHNTHDAPDTHDALITQDKHEDQNISTIDFANINTEMETSKRKQKHIRINMAFYEDHHEYLTYISRINGISITQYINNLVAADKNLNQETIEKAKKLFK